MRLFAVVGLAALAGCILEDGYGPRSRRVIVRDYASHGPNCADMVAAGGIFHDDEKVGPLKEIAGRPLTLHEQVHLIDVVVDTMTSDVYQSDVLTLLAARPDLHPDARMHLARRVRELSSDYARTRVAETLLKNPQKESKPEKPPEQPR